MKKINKAWTQDTYLEFHEDKCQRAKELSARKNTDYADPTIHKNDPLAVWANFTLCEKLGVCTTEQGFLVRLCDKFSRLCHLTAEGHTQMVMDESAEDTEDDIINYICLFSAYKKAKRELEETDGGK